jgi:hypothetical protein
MAEQRGISADDNALVRALTRWENEGGRTASDWEPRVVPVRREANAPQSSTYRLIKAPPVDRDAVAAAFEALATRIQQRDHSARVTALQRAIDENPEAYERYCRAVDENPESCEEYARAN